MADSAPETPIVSGQTEAAAHALADAIRTRATCARLPGGDPATIEAAYAVQNAVVAAFGAVGGWKVSPYRPDGAPRCSPIPKAFFRDAPAALAAADLDAAQAEVEIAVRFGADPAAGGAAPSLDEVAACIASVHPAVELIGSRFADAAGAADLAKVADLQSCAGVVVGPALAGWRGLEFAGLVPALDLDGAVRRAEGPHASTHETLRSLAWLAQHAAARGLPLKAGDVVISGARLGPLPMGGARRIVAGVEGVGELRIDRTGA